MQPWTFPVLLTLALAAVGLVYMRRWFGLRAAEPQLIPASRASAFIAGLAVVWLAIGSPLVTFDHQLLTFHMVKHLLLMAVAAPLILQGAPALLFKPRYKSPHWSGRALVLCWLAGTATVIGWHIPAAFQLALGSHAWHAVENATFLAGGLLFWWPVIDAGPTAANESQWTAPVYLFLATMPCDILSAFLAFCGHVVYPSYLAAPRTVQLSAINDQQFAGALMWVAVTFIYLVPAALITIRILSPRAQSSHIKAAA